MNNNLNICNMNNNFLNYQFFANMNNNNNFLNNNFNCNQFFANINNNIINQQNAINFGMNNINNNGTKEPKSKNSPHKIGLQNLGQTCYMNASLQCLFNIESLSKKLLNKYLILNINTQQLTCAYTTLLYELKKENSKYIDPSIFKKTVGELNPLFQGNAASDSKDLIFFIIERLHQELKPPTLEQKNQIDFNQQELISQNDFLSFQQFFNDLKNSQSCIFDTFYGIHKIQMKCNKCNIIKYSYQTFNMLVFILKKIKEYKIKSIGNGYFTGINLYDAFENDRNLEILDGENMIYCNNCKCLYSGTHQQMMFSLPPVLIIVLNRGRNNLDFNENFDFPEVLNFIGTNYVIYEGSYKKYFLCGIIVHLGESSSSGHFICYCRRSMNEKFVMYNDTIVTENIEIEEAMKCTISNNDNEKRTPYILFYHYF
jgi:ubiquitin C-terminal hydrolase